MRAWPLIALALASIEAGAGCSSPAAAASDASAPEPLDGTVADVLSASDPGSDSGASDSGFADSNVADAGSASALDGMAPPVDASTSEDAAPSCVSGGDAGACSCVGLLPTCGPARTDDCCARPQVPGGKFSRGYDGSSSGPYSDASATATVSTFALDKYEVTVGRFRNFADAYRHGYHPPAGAGKNPNNPTDTGWDPSWNAQLPPDLIKDVTCEQFSTWSDSDADFVANHKSINCVSWFVAFAFCAWDGGRLPTEAEWNYAAAGGDQQRFYPWSSPPSSQTIDATHAVYFTAPSAVVGSKSPLGDARWGHADMAGNLDEWTADYIQSGYPMPCADCANHTGTQRVNRGGAYFVPADDLDVAVRFSGTPDYRSDAVGVRCAYAQ